MQEKEIKGRRRGIKEKLYIENRKEEGEHFYFSWLREKVMETCKNYISKLFIYTAVDIRDESEEKYERAYQNLQQQINGLNDKELHDLLSQLAAKDNKHHEEISIGLLYIILTDATAAQKTYRDLTFIARDGLASVTNNLAFLVADKYTKFTEIARRQLIWILRELVKNQVLNVDNIVWHCLRQASGGDVSVRNLFLVEGLADIFIEHRQWLEKYPFLIGAVVYSYVRLIEDHTNPALINLRNKEVKFVIGLIKDRFLDVIPLGRDFVRLLQNVARIPEFEQLWRDILLNPKGLHPTFNGVWQLLQIRTSRRFLQCRLTPEVERKLHFLTSSVKFGNHKRYQDWFQDKYFSTPESHSLRSDLIRFIINAIHPTNDMLCSDIVPRWAIIGWLLTSCTNPTAQANAKLALFYDWLFFDPNKDNIMNVEPGILVMYRSMRSHLSVSITLLDFLCRIMKNFYPENEDKIRTGIYNSLRKILEKQVIPNLHPLFESPRLDRELRTLVRDNFKEFCTSTVTPFTPGPGGIMIGNKPDIINNFIPDERNNLMSPGHFGIDEKAHHNNLNIIGNFYEHDHTRLEGDAGGGGIGGGGGGIVGSSSIIPGNIQSSDGSNDNTETDADAVFSDEEDERNADSKRDDLTDDDDDLPLSKVRLKEKPISDKVDLPAAISESFEKFLTTKTSSNFEAFLIDYRTFNNSTLNEEQQNYIFNNVVTSIKSALPQSIFPESKSDEKLLAESISYPLFGLFRTMYQYEDKCKKQFQSLLGHLCEKIRSVGYLLLYFLKVYIKLQSRKNSSQNYQYKTSVYKQLCDATDEKIEKCLARDLNALENENSQIFLWLLPDIYREFKANVVNNSEIIRIILSCIDAKNLRDLIYSVTQGKLTLFKNDGLIDCVRESLCYETFEQFCLWQLVQAHDVPIEFLQDILPELESSNHAEALTYMLLLLKNEKPTTELIRLLLSRETKNRGDPFVTSALRYWCQEFEEVLSEIIANLLTSKYPNSSPNKRKRPLKSNAAMNSSPSSDQLLNHLEHFRRSCRHGNGTGTGLYVQDAMQRALQQAYSHSSDNTKKQYSDLFALAAEDETSGVGRRGGSARGRKQPNSKKDTNSSSNANKKNSEPVNNVYSSDEESSEDDWSKPKQTKRRKKALSDSD